MHIYGEEIQWRRKYSRTWGIVPSDEMGIFQYNPETMQQSAVWVFTGETPPVKFKWSVSIAKQTVACFTKSDHVATKPSENRKNSPFWLVVWPLPAQGPLGVMQMLPTPWNPRLVAAATLDFLVEKSVNLITYLPYSPHLATCDWLLFPFVRQQ